MSWKKILKNMSVDFFKGSKDIVVNYKMRDFDRNNRAFKNYLQISYLKKV